MRRFPPPWKVELLDGSFKVLDADFRLRNSGPAGIAWLLTTSGHLRRGFHVRIPDALRAAPEPCKAKVLAYVKFLADGELLDPCIMQLPASDVAAKLIEWMHDHPEYSEKDCVDCLDDAIATLKLCKP